MNTSYLFAFILGSLIKVYDEIIDNDMKVSERSTNIVKFSIIIVLTIIMLGDPILGVVIFFLFVASYLSSSKLFKSVKEKAGKDVEEMDNPFWKQLFYITLSLLVINTIIHWDSLYHLKLEKELIEFIAIIIMIVGAILIEFVNMPEEYSKDKNTLRHIYLTVSIVGTTYLYIYKNISYYKAIISTGFSFIGYMLTWIINKRFILKSHLALK